MSDKLAETHSASYEQWLLKKNKMNQRVRATCEKYGDSVNHTVDTAKFRYVKEHNLLVCTNAKVRNMKATPSQLTSITLGWEHHHDSPSLQAHSWS